MFATCPCHSGKMAASCCLPFLEAKRTPETPEQLMRSRFAAFSLGQAEYIMDTTHPQNRQYQKNREKWKKEIEQFSQEMLFVGLIIHEAKESGNEGWVDFTAQLYSEDAGDCSFRERSRFVKKEGQWLYVDGEIER